MVELEPEVLAAAGFATRYELDAKSGTIIVELVDDAADEWVVRTPRGGASPHTFEEKQLVVGRARALRKALDLFSK
jgi:hypothetical protein